MSFLVYFTITISKKSFVFNVFYYNFVRIHNLFKISINWYQFYMLQKDYPLHEKWAELFLSAPYGEIYCTGHYSSGGYTPPPYRGKRERERDSHKQTQ